MSPWAALVMLLVLVGYGGSFYYAGDKHAADACKAAQLDQDRAVVAAYRAAVARGNAASAQLAQAETAIQTQTAERIKHVPQVTAGRRCLEPAAVRLLNVAAAAPGLPAAAGQPVAADAAAPAASDTDVAGWIAAAGGQYETCAARLNGLIDYEEAKP